MKASLCFLILALFQTCYGTPHDYDDDSSGGHSGGVGGHSVGIGGLPGGISGLPGGIGGHSGSGALNGFDQASFDNPDCSPVAGCWTPPPKVGKGDVGTIALSAPQIAIVDKAKSEIAHGAEACFESATHADVDRTFQIILNTVDKVAVRAAQLIDTIVPGAGTAALKVYTPVSIAAHSAAKITSSAAKTVTGGEAGPLGGAFL